MRIMHHMSSVILSFPNIVVLPQPGFPGSDASDHSRGGGRVRPPRNRVSVQRQIGFMRAHGMSNTGIRRALGLSEREAVEAGIIPSRADVKSQESVSAPEGKEPIAADDESDDGPARRPSGPLMAEVLAAVAQAGEVSSDEIVGASQGRRLMPLRQLTMYLLRELCVGASLPAIGYFLSRDHTTVHYGCRKAEQRLRSAPDFRALHDRVRDSLVPGAAYDV